MKPQTDHSLYLVTDSTDAILGQRDLCEVVQQAIEGGVTLVQYRDKTSDTGALIATAKRLYAICRLHGVPLIINDRVDVALAVGCEGVHVGQDDMDVSTARQMLGPDKIIGASVSSIVEASEAINQGADYLGIGTLYSTATKKNTKNIIGINGVRQILNYLRHHNSEEYQNISTVVIGGVNASNIQRVRWQLFTRKEINGFAIVSAIMAAERPTEAARHIRKLLSENPPFVPDMYRQLINTTDWNLQNELKTHVPRIVKAVQEKKPLSHNMTNFVVQHFAASVALAIGASPIMSNNGLEAPDLAQLTSALVINMGTATPENLRNQCLAIQAYNASGNPIVLDPVGAGATATRRDALATLMAAGYFDLIKGNEREIIAVAKASGLILQDSSLVPQRGVDSGAAILTDNQKAALVEKIAARERNVVLMTGARDFISAGYRTYVVDNGHWYLEEITGSGCTLGTTLAAYMAAEPGDKLAACVAGMLHFEIAAERAARREDVRGPGTFVPAFVDELFRCRIEVGRAGEVGEAGRAGERSPVSPGNEGWVGGARVRICNVGEGDAGFIREF